MLVPLLARSSILGAARVGFVSPQGTLDPVPAAAVPVHDALAEFDFLMTPLQRFNEEQTMAVLSPIGWPSSMLIEDGIPLIFFIIKKECQCHLMKEFVSQHHTHSTRIASSKVLPRLVGLYNH